jgi:heptaprenyl diphosphate synthase
MLQVGALRDIYAGVSGELERVSERLSETLSNCFAVLGDGAYGTDMLNGKLLRPALCLMSGKLFRTDTTDLIKLAAACELVHVATLIHDDVVDRAAVRRGVPSVNARWDEKSAVLSGDRIVCEGLLLLTEYRGIRAAELMLHTLKRVVNGEMEQLHSDRRLHESTCIEVARAKTGSLMSAVCRLPAMWYGAEAERVTALGQFGEHFGIAFQITDDLLDLIGQESKLGKTPLSDIRNGKQTLPMVYLREIMYEHQAIGDGFPEHGVDPFAQDYDARRLSELIRESGAAARTLDKASYHVDMAKRSLDVFPESSAKDALLSLSDFVIDRNC